MRIKVCELAGSMLTWAVAVCEGGSPVVAINAIGVRLIRSDRTLCDYASDWNAAGRIIEREKIQIRGIDAPGHAWDGKWLAQQGKFRPSAARVDWRAHDTFTCSKSEPGYFEGPTALIAAMRCYVAMKMGNEIDVPDDLMCNERSHS